MSLNNNIEPAQTPNTPEKKPFWRRRSTQVGGGAVALMGASILALGGCGKTSSNPDPTDHSTASASTTPDEVSPTSGVHEYPTNPITGREPTVFELTEPLPASMAAMDTMDPDTEFALLSLQDRLRYLSWVDQRQADYNNRFTEINIDVPEAANLNSAPSPNDSALLIIQRASMIANSSYSIADWASGQNPPPIDLNKAKKLLYAVYDSNLPELDAALTALETAPYSFDVVSLASSFRGVVDPENVVSRSDTYRTEDGYDAVDITMLDSTDGHRFVATYIFVPFEDFRGDPQVGVVLRSSEAVS